MELNYHKKLINQVNAMPLRSYYHIINEDKTDLTDFKFAFFNKYEDEVLTINPTKNIKVPSNWQILGYDRHQYTNNRYPFPLNPPHIDIDNPCGVYVTNYEVSSLDKNHYLNIDGADSCIYVFINNQFVGYSTVSHSQVEFDLTSFLKIGNNELRLIVFKWNTFSYLEDQDKLRMSGLFRDVYILRRNKDHIHDFKIQSSYDYNRKIGTLFFSCNKECTLKFNNQTYIAKEITIKVDNVKSWTCETPYLYDLTISYNDEIIKEQVGFRTIEVKNNVLLLNGKAIKFKGVNRHSSTINGYVETIDDILNDIKIIKENNINAIRTSHYPCHKELPFICDKEGIYLMEEADVETHGIVFKDGTYNEKYYNDLANDIMYHDAIIHRQERMIARDKNRPSILIWSLGNESGWGKNFIDAAIFAKKMDDTRLIHYERSFIRNTPYPGDKFDFANDCKNVLDMYSRMYPSFEDLNAMKGNLDKPLILCEYSHAMGNSCGDLNDYEELFLNEESFCGGFIWEFINHCVVENEKLLYGGDFKDEPNDGNFCLDGLVGIDRKVFPELNDVRNIFSYIRVEKVDDSNYIIKNNKYFTTLDDIKCEVYFEKYGLKLDESQCIDITNIAPQSSKVIKIEKPQYNKNLLTINFKFFKENKEIYQKQFILAPMHYDITNNVAKIIVNNDKYIIDNFIINKEGMIESCLKDKNMFKEPSFININRANIDNDRNMFYSYWNSLKLNTAKFVVYNVINKEDEIVFEGALNTVFNNIAKMSITYSASSLGLKVKMNVHITKPLKFLPRFGMSLVLNDNYSETFYLGYGPYESYIDRHQASRLSFYKFNIFSKDNLFNYPYPQESGSHYHTYEATISSDNNLLQISSNDTFSYQAIPFKVNEFKNHSHLMDYNTKQTIINIDYKMSGLGSNSCGPELNEKYQFNEKDFEFEFYLKVK